MNIRRSLFQAAQAVPRTLLKHVAVLSLGLSTALAAQAEDKTVFKAGHASLQQWLMPEVPYPEENVPTDARVELGKMLFFDTRLSGDGNMSCATCHSPLYGWSDGLKTARGFQSKVLGRATPTIYNTAYQSIQMWDGRKKTLEDQALGPMVSSDEMNIGVDGALAAVKSNAEYQALFENAYPGQGVTGETLSMAIASFERTVVSNNSRFDQWVKGNKKALTKREINGFKLFVDPEKGNCAVCHSAPNFTDDSFHNIGLASFDNPQADMGRYAIKPIRILKGAFKAPTVREIAHTAPYFHDGSAATLEDVVEHYAQGGASKSNLSPNIKKLNLNDKEKADLVAFMKALSSEEQAFTLPVLPN